MTVMRAVGNGHQLPRHARVRDEQREYVVELDVADFTASELIVEALGRQITVIGDQVEKVGDDGRAFRLHERLEEGFRLPDDAVVEQIRVFYRHGTLMVRAPRTQTRRRRLPIERPSRLLNPDATPC
jgi:HSP20 family molecular chaperone IbpA